MSKPSFSKKVKSIFLPIVIGLLEHLSRIEAHGGESSDSLSMTTGVQNVSCKTCTSIWALVRLAIGPGILKFWGTSYSSFLIVIKLKENLEWEAMEKRNFKGTGYEWDRVKRENFNLVIHPSFNHLSHHLVNSCKCSSLLDLESTRLYARVNSRAPRM